MNKTLRQKSAEQQRLLHRLAAKWHFAALGGAIVLAIVGVMLITIGNAQERNSSSSSSGSAKEAPGKILDLSNWYLGLPTGGSKSDSVKQPKLDSYTSQYFKPSVSGTGVILKAPVKGATTANSKWTRTELREANSKGKIPFGWDAGSGSHVLKATMSITHLPSKNGKISFAQIHGQGSTWYMILIAQGNGDGTAKLFTKDKTGKADKKTITSNYKLGTKFDLKFSAINGKVSISYNGAQKVTTNSSQNGSYFKIGTYNQSTGDYGETIIYKLNTTHSK